MLMISVWNQTSEKPSFCHLDGNKNTDVLIIGGGIAGILCANELKEKGVDCILLEANEICQGITKNTTAKITVQHSLIFRKLLKNHGFEKALAYARANEEALKKYENICSDIQCDFEHKDNYVYVLDNKKKLEDEAEAMMKLGMNPVTLNNLPLPFKTQGAVGLKNQAQFNPLKFLCQIAKNLPIYENTKVLEYKNGRIISNHGTVTAKKIICATHFPMFNKHGLYSMKMYQRRSYVLALKNAAYVNGMYIDGSDRGLSMRNYGDLLLLGGGGHRTGKNGGGWRYLQTVRKDYYPNSSETARWATQDCITLDTIPYIGQYSKNTPELYVITGFNKWGMTTAMAGAMILADMITEKKNDFQEVFNPSRSMLTPQLFINSAEAVTDILAPGTKRCPHMGCRLKRNKQEHSWDCPCHGSRFTSDGKLIDNPASDDMKGI